MSLFIESSTGITLDIVVPPSANHLWSIFGNRMHKKKAYRDWLEHCDGLIRETMSVAPEGPVWVTIVIIGGPGFTRSRDVDNCIKPCLDLLRHAEILDTDNVTRVLGVTAFYQEPGKKSKVPASCSLSIDPVTTELLDTWRKKRERRAS